MNHHDNAVGAHCGQEPYKDACITTGSDNSLSYMFGLLKKLFPKKVH